MVRSGQSVVESCEINLTFLTKCRRGIWIPHLDFGEDVHFSNWAGAVKFAENAVKRVV
jgi:hypothetical protein